MNNKQLDALIRKGENTMLSIGDGLYFRIARKNPSWVVKYIIAGKRSQIALPQSYPSLSISDAKQQALQIKQNIKLGIDPKSERKKTEFKVIHNIDGLFDDWYQSYALRNLKHSDIPKSHYNNKIKQHIGVMTIKDVTPQHIRKIINTILESGHNTVANKVLALLKTLFNHAIKLDLTAFNPAQAFTPKDAGGTEESRERSLRVDEISYAFPIMRAQSPSFTRDNYLACCLLLCLGCRKGELISAKWEEFDLLGKIWRQLPNKQRKNVAVRPVTIPIPNIAIPWLEELKYRSGGSAYVFPARKTSKRGYISDDTINHALQKLFGINKTKTTKVYPNVMPNIEHFTLHDLRRTCRSLLSQLGVNEQVAERCLNHKVKGIVGVYDRYQYFDERREALNKLADFLAPYLVPQAAAQNSAKAVGDNVSNHIEHLQFAKVTPITSFAEQDHKSKEIG
ncbi:integrase [Vibrio sp. ES.051]|uniref:tyrosine-type recombinase/integrase n=1 Tax=Vibrio sp. ES.051 TaxID=1761909 RepID=UPI000BF9A715|nr:site-specific integrase [Vibrio sp. ES.051]PFG45524.1 integrase [Vibrio sp. ES.051]